MKITSYVLMLGGLVGLFLAWNMYDDIRIAAFIGAITAIISGFGLLQVSEKFEKIKDSTDKSQPPK
jgi:energy-converting hydrogenase Eha subunit C